MNQNIKKRVQQEAEYINKTNLTIREISKIFNVSKSTVHKDLHERLVDIDLSLFYKIDDILKYHINIRHIRGGESTKKKYKKLPLLAWTVQSQEEYLNVVKYCDNVIFEGFEPKI